MNWNLWVNHCVLSAAGADNDNANSNNIIYTIKDRKFYVPVFTLSTKHSQKLSKLLSKGLEMSVYWNEYKTKSESKDITKEYKYFLQSKFVGINKTTSTANQLILILNDTAK